MTTDHRAPAGVRPGRLAALVPPGTVANPITHPSFTVVHRRGRRWVDEDEVNAYVEQVRHVHAAWGQRLAGLDEELDRIKTALADWQRRHAPAATDDGYLVEAPPPRPLRDTDITAEHTTLPYAEPARRYAQGWDTPPGQ